MRFRSWTPLCNLLTAATIASMTSAAAAQTTPRPAQAGFVKSLRGDVQLLNASGVMRTARVGDEVAPTERVVTGVDSAASLVLRDGTVLVLGPSSRLEVKAFSFDPTEQDGSLLVSLLRGSLRMISGLIAKAHPEAVRVETQTATIGIRGTDFIVRTDQQP